jgi:hypothetical protein
MEDDLNILKVEYLSNHWSDLPKISKLSLGDQTKIKFVLEFEIKTTSDRPPMDDDLKILKVEYLSHHWSDLPHFSNQNYIWLEIWNEDDLR